MKTIDPIGRREKNLERIAARHGLTFYLDGRFLTTISGWDTTTREATDEEITMWSLISLENPDYLPASPEEIKVSWSNRKGPFTINAKDYHGLKGCGPNYFVPEDNKNNLLLGMIGHFLGKECIEGDPCRVLLRRPAHPRASLASRSTQPLRC